MIEKMRVAMRDKSKACEREGGWMKECSCLKVAQLCAAAIDRLLKV